MKAYIRSVVWWLGVGGAMAAAVYAASAGVIWCRYGHAKRATHNENGNSRLDLFMPVYEVVEHHHVRVAAPVETTFSAAYSLNLQRSAIIRAIFRTREFVLGGKSEKKQAGSPGLVDQAKAWGWGVLAEYPGREIIFGAATQPWCANPVFRALPPAQFTAFQEPDYVKIAWTLRADPVDTENSVARTETRCAATDPVSRARFRRYWAFVSPGIILIRRLSLGLVRTEAERRAGSILKA